MLMVAISKEAFITAQHRVAAGTMIANQQISMLPVKMYGLRWLTQRHEPAEFRLAPLRVRPEESTEEDASTQRAPILQIEQQAPRQSQPQQEPEAQEAGSDDSEQLRMKLDMCNRQIAVSNATINQMETAIETLEAPNVRRTLRALLGDRYMVDSDRGSNFTVPGRCATTDWHRDGNDKRRHHHPRMLMGLYYPQAVTLKMGPTAIVARSQWLSDFDPGYQHHEVLATPRQSTAGVNNCGDYLGTGRGGAREPMMSTVPQHFGRPRYMAVPAGTLMIMCVRSQSARRTHRTAPHRTALLGRLTAHRPAPALISVRPT
eukprot:COSAG01_NODE_16371_length_1242_cov_0.961505_1_plen_317_part_00